MENSSEKKAERVAALVGQMRENSQEMRPWKNIPLAKECVSLLSEIDEPPMGKALAVEAIVRQLPEHDVPRLVLLLLRYEQDLLHHSDEAGKEGYPTVDDVQKEINRLWDYIDVENVTPEEFMAKYRSHLKADPIERTQQWEDNYYEVEKECDSLLGDTPRGMGFCFAYWGTLRQVLAKRGIEWHSPAELNPGVLFD